jgi:anti-sigma factor ChrR (cupin superfamily)
MRLPPNIRVAPCWESANEWRGTAVPNVRVIEEVLRSGFEMSNLEWKPWIEPGRAGVERCELWLPSDDEPSICMLIRYPAGSHGDFHEHLGYELMLVLDGQLDHSDGRTFTTGTLIVEEPGTTHRMSTRTGATILAIRTKPTVPLPDDAQPLPERISTTEMTVGN